MSAYRHARPATGTWGALLLALALLLVLAAPAARSQPVSTRALGAQDAAAIRSVHVISAVPVLNLLDSTQAQVSRTLAATYVPPGAGAAGILGVAIGAAIGGAILRARLQRSMETFALEHPRLVDAMGSFDPIAALSEDFEAAFAGDTRFEVVGFEHLHGKVAKDAALVDAKTPADRATLLIESTMVFTETLDVFTIQATAWLARPGAGADVYARNFIFESPTLGTGSNRESMDAWSAESAALFRGTVAMGAARMVMLDLLDPKAPLPAGRNVRGSEIGREGLFEGAVGQLLGGSGSVVFVRDREFVRAMVRSPRFTARLAQEGLEMRLARGGQRAAPARPLTLEDLGGLLAPR